MEILVDDLGGAAIAALLRDHKQDMVETSPEDSIHTLTIDDLRAASFTVWSAWDADEILGCGALKEHDASMAEIKSMRTAEKHRGRGVASTLLQHMLDVARERGYETLYLETGSSPAFRPAHALYKKAGFCWCGPFADYREDPFSQFMMRRI